MSEAGARWDTGSERDPDQLIRSRDGHRADTQRRGVVDRSGRRNGDLELEAILKFQHDTSPVWPSASCLAFWDVEYCPYVILGLNITINDRCIRVY